MDQRLTLQRAAVVRRVDALFRAMSSDFLLREQFVTDPAQILSEYVYSKKLSPEETAPVNHLIYSVMANRGLLRWLRDRSFQPRGREQSSGVFVAEFTRAAVRHGDHNVVEALIRNSSVAARPIAFDGALLSEIVRTTLGFEDGTEHSPGGGGTQQSGTHTTEQSTGRAEARRWLERAADEFRQAFLLRADATEHSPGGGGTQQSGTHTTEHSTGGVGTRGWLERAADEFRQAFLFARRRDRAQPWRRRHPAERHEHHQQSTGRAEARGWLERAAEEAREVFLFGVRMQRSTAPAAAEPSRAAPMSPSTAPAAAERAAGCSNGRQKRRDGLICCKPTARRRARELAGRRRAPERAGPTPPSTAPAAAAPAAGCSRNGLQRRRRGGLISCEPTAPR